MDFLHPLALLALVPLTWVIYWSGKKRLRRLPWLRAISTLLLRVLISTLLLLSLAGPRITLAAPGVHVVFVLDQSDSMGGAGRLATQAWVHAALAGRHADDTASLVAFGASPAWMGSLSSGTLPPIPGVEASGTDIAAAIRLATAGLPADQPSRVVLLSDGRQTSGDALQAAQQAAGDGVPISVVPIRPPSGDVAVDSLGLPAYVRSGESITLRVGLHTDRAETVRLRLRLDGEPLGERAVALRAGLNNFFFAQVAGQPGVHHYGATVAAPNDPVPQNDSMDATMVVGPAPRILVLSTRPADAGPLVRAIGADGSQVHVLPAAQAPTSAAAMDQYDAVVLADVPASTLSRQALSALQAGVRDDGRGLLVTGGPHSFTTGGYANSGLERLLPLTSLAMAHAGHAGVGLILIIDKSGSMMDEVQGVSKISMAQQAAIEAIAHLQPTDSFGVLAFDDTTHVVIPFGPVGGRGQQARSRDAILGIEPFGDTVIYPALRQAARSLFASHAVFKHVVLMTDGQGETAPFLKLIKLMRQNNITLSTIAIGADAEVEELRGFAGAGGGRFYYAADPRDIPRLVVLETRISSGPTRVQGQIGVRQGANSSALRSLVGQRLPPLNAYNITTARPTAQVPLQSQLGDPLFAQWHYGLGRVAAWAGGSAADWAGSWFNQHGFWSDALHGILPVPAPQLLRPDLAQTGDALRIGVDALTTQGQYANLLTTRAQITDPAGRTQTVPLIQDAPGHYAATLPGIRQGAYAFTFAQYDGTVLLRRATGSIAVPYSAEYAPGTPNLALLQAIAAAGNAPTLAHPADAFSDAGLPARPAKREIWPALALLALLLFPLDVALRVLYTPPVPYDPRRFAEDRAQTDDTRTAP